MEITETEQKKKNQKNEDSLWYPWDNIKQTNIVF